MHDVDSPSLGGYPGGPPSSLYEEVQIELANLRLETQRNQLKALEDVKDALEDVKKYLMWTMIAMAAHAGVGVISAVPGAAGLIP